MSSSDSDDDLPLAARAAAKTATAPANANGSAPQRPAGGAGGASNLSARPPRPGGRSGGRASDDDDSDSASYSDSSDASSGSDSEDDVPLSQRTPQRRTPAASAGAKRKHAAGGGGAGGAASKRSRPSSSARSSSKKPEKGEPKWSTLVHHGVLFPPEYEPHGVRMLYDGKPVDLTPEQEEVASMFAIMKETDYMSKPTFLHNFWDGFKAVLGKGHIIQSLERCDFTPIYDHLMAERDRKKTMTKEVCLNVGFRGDAAP